jgi:hypothetical protein
MAWNALIGLARAWRGLAAPADAAKPDDKYLIGPLDTLNLIVWRNPELSLTVPVRPDGRISTPLVEDLVAQGRKPDRPGARSREGPEQVHARSGCHYRGHTIARAQFELFERILVNSPRAASRDAAPPVALSAST